MFDYWNIFFQLYYKKILEKFKNNINGKDSVSLNSLSLNNKMEIDLANFYQHKKIDLIFDAFNQENSILMNYIINNIGFHCFYLNSQMIGNNICQKILLNGKIYPYLFKKNEVYNDVEKKDISSFQTSIQNNYFLPLKNEFFLTKNTFEKSFPNKIFEIHQNINHEKSNNSPNIKNNNNQNLNFENNNKQIITKKTNTGLLLA